MKKAILICGLFVFLLSLVMVNQSLAVPSLGVATESFYYVSEEEPLPLSGEELDDYQEYFVGEGNWDWASSNGGSEGFLIVSTDTELIIFTNLTGVDIYLLTDSATEASHSPSFDGDPFAYITIQRGGSNSGGYKPPPYYGVNLGPVDNTWEELDGNIFNPNTFYAYTGVITYSGDIDNTTYFFAATQYGDYLNFNSYDGDRPDEFSPKTTSAVGGPPIPEPATLLLLGSGLMGVFLFRKRGV